jgi:hypothetical protein
VSGGALRERVRAKEGLIFRKPENKPQPATEQEPELLIMAKKTNSSTSSKFPGAGRNCANCFGVGIILMIHLNKLP